MSLQEEIDEKASQIYRDAYQMSIGELINLYREKELDIHPEFQRVFRWSSFQKTRLIESIVLNIPIPPIFVSQREDGVWDVVDGVQRLATIFEFVGEYASNDASGSNENGFVLEGTDYLPSFEGMKWRGEDETHSFTTEQKINFKRARIDVIIVKKESDPQCKYELFQRLNTGGSRLSYQEIRNCLIIMTNKELYDFLLNLCKNKDFDYCTPVSERLVKEQYKMELILRLLVACKLSEEEYSQYRDLSDLLDKESIKLAQEFENQENIFSQFKNTFEVLNGAEGENVFKRHYPNNEPKGAFLSAAYQGIATGVMSNISEILQMDNEQRDKWICSQIREYYNSDIFVNMMGQGVKPSIRFKTLSLFGKTLFSPKRNEK